MTAERRPILAFAPPREERRSVQPRRYVPRLTTPGAERQGERLSSRFRELQAAFEAERARLAASVSGEVDPELVVVFDLAGSVKDFQNAIRRIEGLEFLSELVGEESGPDEDFYMLDQAGERAKGPVGHSLYLVMSNARAVDELLRLFNKWKEDPDSSFERGLGKFKEAFHQLSCIRRWGAEDRIRETGLLEHWQETLAVAGESVSSVRVEVELWYRAEQARRAAAEVHVEEVVTAVGGLILDRAQIGEIGYHAILAELPIQQVAAVLRDGAAAIRLLTTDEVMFVSPSTPMSVVPAVHEPIAGAGLPAGGRVEGLPRVALLDGMPFQNHDVLAGRLVIDDPDGIAESYPILARHHGTAMASLIVHGDLSNPGVPLDRKLYVRPIMRPHELNAGHEQLLPDRLLPDLLHRAIRRMHDGEDGRGATAPSVRVVNLSIGAQVRALTRRMSPVGRLLDWLAVSYNLLFVVSAGNHVDTISIRASDACDAEMARRAATRAVSESSLLRGVLPPGDALNAITVGATHDDTFDDVELPDTVWDITAPGAPSHYSATGPGVGRSIKPDIYHTGGRAVYQKPPQEPGGQRAVLALARSGAKGPGLQVASPGRGGATSNTVFTFGTSNAAALVTREASRLFDVLESGRVEGEDAPLPDPLYHPLLVRALLAHASSWGDWESRLRRELGLTGKDARRKLSFLLGYGKLDTARLGSAATNRAVLVAGGRIGRDQRHTYEFPLPPSLQSSAVFHRFTITLACAVPAVGSLVRYRGAKVYFDFASPESTLAIGERAECEWRAVRRGTLQHEIVQGDRAMAFKDGEEFPIHIECMDDARHLSAEERIRYALVVSVETAENVSTTIYDEVRARLREKVRVRSRQGIQG